MGSFSGDGEPATQARLRTPLGVAVVTVDADRNVYIADAGNNRIRLVDLEGVITTFAGTGERSFSGDGRPATEAQLAAPRTTAVDEGGNVYIADAGNNLIRRVDPEGVITTFAGTGEAGFSGDGGPAAEAQLDNPYGLALDSNGNVYIADRSNHRIRRVGPDGVITAFAGTGDGGFSGDDGPATQAQLDSPPRVAVDANGNVYIADVRNNRIRRVDPEGVITTFAGTGVPGFSGDGGPAAEAELNTPQGMAPEEVDVVEDTGDVTAILLSESPEAIFGVDEAVKVAAAAKKVAANWGR